MGSSNPSRFDRIMEGVESVVAAPVEGIVRGLDAVDRFRRRNDPPPRGRMMTPPHLNQTQFKDV